MRRTHIVLLAAFGCAVAVSLLVYWRMSDPRKRLDSLVGVVRAQRSEQETMGALVDILRWYEKEGQLGRITTQNAPELLGMDLKNAIDLPCLPVPWLDVKLPYTLFAIDFRQTRKGLRLVFHSEEGKLSYWWIVDLAPAGTRTLY